FCLFVLVVRVLRRLGIVLHLSFFFLFLLPPPPRSPLSPYTTLFRSSVPPSRICPPRIRPLAGNRPRTARAVVVLPEPDSPTRATTSPLPMLSDTPWVTCRVRRPEV